MRHSTPPVGKDIARVAQYVNFQQILSDGDYTAPECTFDRTLAN
jgi:hypothetical protein